VSLSDHYSRSRLLNEPRPWHATAGVSFWIVNLENQADSGLVAKRTFMLVSSGTKSRAGSTIFGALIALVALFPLQSCTVVSINSLYEDVTPKDPDVVFEKGLIGNWFERDQKCVTTVTIASNDDAYDLQSAQGEGCIDPREKVRQQARLVKLGAYYFVDMFPTARDVCDTCLALHQIFLMRFTADTITLIPIDAESLRALLSTKKLKLSIVPEDPRALFPDRPLTLTALSKDLKDFCSRFAADKTIFKPESAELLKRVRG
jgi:hypothetical protein